MLNITPSAIFGSFSEKFCCWLMRTFFYFSADDRSRDEQKVTGGATLKTQAEARCEIPANVVVTEWSSRLTQKGAKR
jgi:hypothetical protein